MLSQPASGEAGASDGAETGFAHVITGAMFGTSLEILGASCWTEALPSSFFADYVSAYN